MYAYTFKLLHTSNLLIQNTYCFSIIADESQVNLDYDSDESLKGKNYEPNEDNYNSSCSQISNSPTQTTSACMYQVKKRLIFSPEKFHKLPITCKTLRILTI